MKKRRTPVPKSPGLYKVEVWDDEVMKWSTPKQGKKFSARRRAYSGGKQEEKYFDLRDEALQWLKGYDLLEPPKPEYSTETRKEGLSLLIGARFEMTFEDLWERYRKKAETRIRASTLGRYDNMKRLYFAFFSDLKIYEITPRKVEEWLDQMKNPVSWTGRSNKRLNACFDSRSDQPNAVPGILF